MTHLTGQGLQLLARNYRTPGRGGGEIDLVMRRGKTLAIVEVKARVNYDDAAAAIHHQNQSRVMRAAQMFLAQHPECAHLQVRFDAVLLAWYRFPHHIKHAFHH